MDYIRKTYIEFTCCNRGDILEEIESRDISKVKVPNEDVFAFTFFDILITTVETDSGPVELKSAPINESPMYYYGGQIYTCAEVACLPGGQRKIFELNWWSKNDLKKWDKVIRTRTGSFRRFFEEDILIKEIV